MIPSASPTSTVAPATGRVRTTGSGSATAKRVTGAGCSASAGRARWISSIKVCSGPATLGTGSPKAPACHRPGTRPRNSEISTGLGVR